MKEVKCDCGHVNPIGTILCESCGKVLEEKEKDKKLLDMRYEGSARRSQTYNKTIIDKIWNFFSSVKVGVWLIVITLIASAVGTILPQEMYIPPIMPAEEYYEDQYGWIGKLYYDLGFHNLYSSWWYLILIASIGISLVICSLDRVVPLYRALKKQKVSRHESYLQRQRVFGASQPEDTDKAFTMAKEKLKSKKYSIREENGNILAEKGRFSRWGPYVNHVGLIIFLIGGMLRFVPGMYVDKILWIREGETKVIPETNGEYYLKNDGFILEMYDKEKDNEVFGEAIDKAGMVAKNYQSNVILYKKQGDTVAGEEADLKKVKDYEIKVNKPLKFENFALYQVDYKLNELNKMSFALTNKKTGKEYGDLTVDLNHPQDEYDLGNGYKAEVVSYFPDFEFDENGEPVTKSRIPNNPAFVFKMFTPDKPDGEISFVAIRQTIEPFGDNEYKMAFKGIDTKNVSALTVRKDLTLWIIALGGVIFMIGVAQGSYWNHRRVWLRRVNGEVWVAGHTNKNWHGLKREIEAALDGTGITMPEDQLQNQSEKKG
ncbi:MULTISPECIES: cytochrome c biogenesis protein ResB [Bacillaceae]|jgi:cytochrome c biogenesis protein|uniref:Cytochrome c biogenesis protein ResB n=1 Tax=Cytobacillus firmus TaxID=1399 RepID=A0AA46Q2K0_CYTFI|nr:MULTISPECIES: cytochrome c biogenesis protein ResB [Bacillaceae]KML46171.1 cytochrome C biogenesis protein [Cytobacillus firmus]MCC3647826.1 cytochrome c biogenesis protein [Cytobacillus oceanisediminis]MCS0654076.1 cytochrome c biogenesis protein ResB [Cytobacillus firmus]MCU1805732.1 cytochrome c biogenesis protein ResB [Cytobacillus firmus]UYG94709.1 cytochrome c biogenesis protein ResB [Cytobacillus firmus]